ncbi:glycoside hydrolase family 3 N-terminal domain-containing protein [Amnibacterium sp.]|uniref:glycoside hydrolase family 3 N-terminal domain-containing protein n=1 Tax=Amnibacterium sp. TaxID=1872496 RepID=UPI00262B9EC9|nr:glycoside hydrolase family 3 N-terminal domain-containing protein [Amnibacterium sp.]MCU1475132.1 Beta-N-acetylhexosaminidase [Amnibacterium sp.]
MTAGRVRHRAVRAVALAGGVLLLAGCAAKPPTSSYTPHITVAPAATAAPSPSPTSTPSPTATTAGDAAAVVEGMSVEQQAGTVLMTAGTVDELPGLAALVRDGAVGGVMIRGRSSAGVDAVAAAVRTVTTAADPSVPLLVATDEEGGEVQVLSGPGFGAIPSAVDQAGESPTALTAATERWGRALADAGVNLDLAPVADTPCTANLHDNPPVADLRRNYGTDPVAAARSVAAVVRGLAATGIGATVKHFPGLGCVSQNTDTDAHVVDDAITVDSARLAPFSAGMTAGARAVMVSSAIYDRIDGSRPALFSTIVIGGLLRGRLGFRGMVMSDDVGAAAALAAWTPGQRATRFVAAGGDLLLDIVPDHIPAERAALVAAAAADPAFATKLRAAAVQVVAARLGVGR